MKRAVLLIASLVLVITSCGLKVPVTLVEGEGFTQDPSQVTDGAGPADDGATDDVGDIGDDVTDIAGPDDAIKDGGDGPVDVAGLFENETEGITKDKITICTHVPITGAAPIPHHPDRFGQFYFNYVNKELGGVYGRKVQFLAFNDEYNPAGARRAVEKCKRAGSFFYVGAAGTDQIVSVAKWAERNRVPYFHGPTSDKDLQGTKYNVHIGPTYEYQHELLAEYLIDRYGTKDAYGTIKVNSPFFDAGAAAFKKAIEKRGGRVAAEITVQKDERQFQNVYFELQDKNVRIINNFTTPTIWINMLNQKPATYNPTWTAVSPIAGFNVVAAVLKNNKAVVFHHFNPACECIDYSDANIGPARNLPWWGDIKEFLRIFRQYSPEQKPDPDDFDYASYLGAKGLHRLLLEIGPQPTRTKLWGLLNSYKENAAKVSPGCGADFSRTDNRKGAWRVNIFELVSSKGVWKQAASCVDKV